MSLSDGEIDFVPSVGEYLVREVLKKKMWGDFSKKEDVGSECRKDKNIDIGR